MVRYNADRSIRRTGFSLTRQFLFCACLVCGMYSESSAVENDRKDTVALVMKALSNPFFSRLETGARGYASTHGVKLEVFGTESETDLDQQIAIVKNLIDKKYGAIAIAPASSTKLVPLCKAAMDRGIPVINVDNKLNGKLLTEMALRIPFVGPDNREGGAIVGRYMRRLMKGQGKVVVMEGIRGNPNSDFRRDGFIQAVTADSKIQVVACDFANFHTAEGFSLMTKFLEKFPDLGGVFCVNDCMALGAIRAIDMADKTGKIWMTSYDNLEEARNEIRNGRLHATVEQYPEQLGASSVRLAVDAMEGRTVPDNTWMDLDLVSYESFGKTIGVGMADAENPFFIALNSSVRQTCGIFGIKLVVKNAANDVAKQLSDIAGFIEKDKVNLLLLTPAQTASMVPGVEMANTAKIPVMTVARKVAEGTVVCHVQSDNVAGGRLAAEFIAEKLGGKGTIVELEGIADTSVSFERGKGFNESLLKYPGLKVVARETGDFRRDKAGAVIRRLLEKKIRFDAVFAHSDSMVLGVIDVLKEHALNGKVVTVGYDAIPDARRAIEEGCLTATIAQKVDQIGKMVARNGAAYFRGDPIKPVTLVDVDLVTKINK